MFTMNKGQFTNGHDSRRNLEGRPLGAKNYKTVLSNFIEAKINYNNPLTECKIECTPIEAMLTHLLYLGLVKDSTSAMKVLLDKIDEIEDSVVSCEKCNRFENWTEEDLDKELERLSKAIGRS